MPDISIQNYPPKEELETYNQWKETISQRKEEIKLKLSQRWPNLSDPFKSLIQHSIITNNSMEFFTMLIAQTRGDNSGHKWGPDLDPNEAGYLGPDDLDYSALLIKAEACRLYADELDKLNYRLRV